MKARRWLAGFCVLFCAACAKNDSFPWTDRDDTFIVANKTALNGMLVTAKKGGYQIHQVTLDSGLESRFEVNGAYNYHLSITAEKEGAYNEEWEGNFNAEDIASTYRIDITTSGLRFH
jgi:hypothetical protein